MAELHTNSRLKYLAVYCVFCISVWNTAAEDSRDCSHMEFIFGNQTVMSPSPQTNGNQPRVCFPSSVCCPPEVESQFISLSASNFNNTLVQRVDTLRGIFSQSAMQFDAFFVTLLNNSKLELHRMLVKEYGLLYEQNSHIFIDLFRHLIIYFKTGQVDLTDILEQFFEALFQRVFVMLNSQYSFNEAYEECVAENMKDVAPFGRVPRQLTLKIERSFVASRTFMRGLAVGRDVLADVINKANNSLTSPCLIGLARLFHCPHCRVPSAPKPCRESCTGAVHDLCINNLVLLDSHWNSYINELVKLAEKLEGPLGIENVVEDIDVTLSEAIGNLQENLPVVNDKVYKLCGQPTMEQRRKRSAVSSSAPVSNRPPKPRSRSTTTPAPPTTEGISLEAVVRGIRTDVNDSVGFWVQLPDGICFEWNSTTAVDAECWNGIDIERGQNMSVRPSSSPVGSHTTPATTSSAVGQQLLRLVSITSSLRRAHRADAVEDIDGSGLGADEQSGSGDGDDPEELSISATPPQLSTHVTRPQHTHNIDNKCSVILCYGKPTSFAISVHSHSMLVLPVLVLVIYRIWSVACSLLQ